MASTSSTISDTIQDLEKRLDRIKKITLKIETGIQDLEATIPQLKQSNAPIQDIIQKESSLEYHKDMLKSHRDRIIFLETEIRKSIEQKEDDEKKTKLAPIKINLISRPNQSLTGGDSEYILDVVDNVKNNFLVSEDSNYVFQFNDALNTKKHHSRAKYLGRGSMTAVFSILNIKAPLNSKIPRDRLILRIIDEDDLRDIETLIKKWKDDKFLLPNNIPELYMYGTVKLSYGVTAHYLIVKQYYDYILIDKLPIPDKIILLHELLKILWKLQECNYIYRDLKSSNIGYDIDSSGKLQLIILDYDAVTILNINDPFFDRNDFKQGCTWFCAGTYPPYYMMNSLFKKDSTWKSKLGKLSVFGLAEVIILLFYTKPGLLFFSSTFDSRYGKDPYQGLYSYLSADTNYGEMKDNLLKVENKSISAEDDKVIKDIALILLERDYDKIPYFSEILNTYEKHFKLQPDKTLKSCKVITGGRIKRFKLVRI